MSDYDLYFSVFIDIYNLILNIQFIIRTNNIFQIIVPIQIKAFINIGPMYFEYRYFKNNSGKQYLKYVFLPLSSI